MDDASSTDAPGPDAPGSSSVGRKKTWVAVLVVMGVLLMCGCASVLFLVSTGIIAEPETVIEQVVRALLGS